MGGSQWGSYRHSSQCNDDGECHGYGDMSAIDAMAGLGCHENPLSPARMTSAGLTQRQPC